LETSTQAGSAKIGREYLALACASLGAEG